MRNIGILPPRRANARPSSVLEQPPAAARGRHPGGQRLMPGFTRFLIVRSRSEARAGAGAFCDSRAIHYRPRASRSRIRQRRACRSRRAGFSTQQPHVTPGQVGNLPPRGHARSVPNRIGLHGGIGYLVPNTTAEQVLFVNHDARPASRRSARRPYPSRTIPRDFSTAVSAWGRQASASGHLQALQAYRRPHLRSPSVR